ASRRIRRARASRSSRPRPPSGPRRSRLRSASRRLPPASTSSPTWSTAARTSYGGASGSGPPRHSPYRYRFVGMSDPVDGPAVVGEVLRQPTGQVQPFEDELDAGRRLTTRRRVTQIEPFEHLGQAG